MVGFQRRVETELHPATLGDEPEDAVGADVVEPRLVEGVLDFQSPHALLRDMANRHICKDSARGGRLIARSQHSWCERPAPQAPFQLRSMTS